MTKLFVLHGCGIQHSTAYNKNADGHRHLQELSYKLQERGVRSHLWVAMRESFIIAMVFRKARFYEPRSTYISYIYIK